MSSSHTSHDSATSNPPQGSQKPLSGLSLYAGISFSTKSAESPTSAEAKVNAASSAPSGDNTSAPAVATSTPTSSWSAALRFAPRKSSSTSSAGGLNRNRPRAAIVAPSFSSFESNPLQGEEEQEQDTATRGEEAPPSATVELKGRSRSSPGTAAAATNLAPSTIAASGWSSIAPRSAAQSPPQSLSMPPATSLSSIAAATPTIALTTPASTSSKYILPLVTRPPELRLSQAEVDADRAMARDAAIARGERGQLQHQQAYRAGEDDYDDGGFGAGGWDQEEDINGFAMSNAGQKAKKKRAKRKRAHSPGKHNPAALNWDADYDPRAPNDYATWKEVVRGRREALKRIEAQKRREERGGAIDDEDEEADWEAEKAYEVDEERLKRYRKWAPPPSYAVTTANNRQGTASNDQNEQDEEKLYISPPPPEKSDVPAYGSQVTPYPTQPPPLFVQATQKPDSPSLSHCPGGSSSASVPHRAMTGEEAYQRRLAMSQQSLQPSPSTAPVSLPPPTNEAHGMKGVEAEAGRAPVPAPAAPPNMDLAARQSAAAAIAARLASIAPPPAPLRPSQPQHDASRSHDGGSTEEHEGQKEEGGDFATRLMSKWGHQTGQGLGAEGNQGMTEALVMDKVPLKVGGRKDHASANANPKESRGGGGGPRGKYTTVDPHKRADLDKYGDPSEVILLHGLLPPPPPPPPPQHLVPKQDGSTAVGSIEEVDEALPGEIAEECSKYGYVQRVAIFPRVLAPPPPSPAAPAPAPAPASSHQSHGRGPHHDDVRANDEAGAGAEAAQRSGGVVFVVFSGQVGAYKAVRELHGRFFSGRRVRARYFDAKTFERGEEGWREEVRDWLAGGPPGGKREG